MRYLLVIEDEFNRVALSACLREFGHDVEAMQNLSELRPSDFLTEMDYFPEVIVLDYNGAELGVSYLSLSRFLKAMREKQPQLKVALLSKATTVLGEVLSRWLDKSSVSIIAIDASMGHEVLELARRLREERNP